MAFPDAEHPGHQVATKHKLAVRGRLADLARQAKVRDPEGLAAQLSLLLDGEWISARMFRHGDNPATHVSHAAQALIDAHRRIAPRRAAGKRR